MGFFSVSDFIKSGIVAALFTLTVQSIVKAQKVSIHAETLIGSYSMRDSKEVQDNIVFLMLGNERIDIDHRIYHNFPAYPAVDMHLRFTGNHFSLGLVYGYYSTGSRWYYKDYSGELVFDQLVKGNKFAVELQKFQFPVGSRFQLKPALQVGSMASTLQMNNSIHMYSREVLTEEIDVKASQFFTLPSALLQYDFKELTISARLGYHLQMGSSKNKVGTLKDRWDSYSYHEEKKFGWSGFRAGLAVGFSLF